jgi:hypothetical protein
MEPPAPKVQCTTFQPPVETSYEGHGGAAAGDDDAWSAALSRTVTRKEQVSADVAFLAAARLDQPGFFDALVAAGHKDISASPLAGFIFRGAAAGHTRGATRAALETALHRGAIARAVHRDVCHRTCAADAPRCVAISRESFPDLVAPLMAHLHELMPPGLAARMTGDPAATAEVGRLLDDEAFTRYDTDGDGQLDEGECVAMGLTLLVLVDGFAAACPVLAEGEGPGGGGGGLMRSPSAALSKVSYVEALRAVGLGDVSRTLQGQFVNDVFERADVNGDGAIDFAEFMRAAARIAHPARFGQRLATLPGFPGAAALAANGGAGDGAELAKFVAGLQTGDLILMENHEILGQFLSCALDSPWNHVAVVIRREAPVGERGDVPNERTEALLQRYPFRRATHRFCSPGYCRCFDQTAAGAPFAPSKLAGTGEVCLLESTGEGIHLHDLGHRLFESAEWADRWVSAAVVRLRKGERDLPDRGDAEKVNFFVESVRGSLYSVARNELGESVAFHTAAAANDSARHLAALPEADRSTDDFCSSIAARFYQHMGWLDAARKPNSIMPLDFDVASSSGGAYAQPVALLHGASLAPPEVLYSPALKHRLPIRLPRQKK